jgi:rod shape-determining protein MreB
MKSLLCLSRAGTMLQVFREPCTITTNEMVKAVERELRLIIKAIKDVFQETPPELASDIIDNGIIMSGGSSLLRNLPLLIERKTGVKGNTC